MTPCMPTRKSDGLAIPPGVPHSRENAHPHPFLTLSLHHHTFLPPFLPGCPGVPTVQRLTGDDSKNRKGPHDSGSVLFAKNGRLAPCMGTEANLRFLQKMETEHHDNNILLT